VIAFRLLDEQAGDDSGIADTMGSQERLEARRFRVEHLDHFPRQAQFLLQCRSVGSLELLVFFIPVSILSMVCCETRWAEIALIVVRLCLPGNCTVGKEPYPVEPNLVTRSG